MENLHESKANILIVDDDILIAESAKFQIKKANYKVAGIAVNAQEAINLAKEKCPDLILMDINLGSSEDGITAAEKIQKFSDIPFIFVTAYSDKATIERAKKIGPFGYLIKPYDNRELLVAIETSLYKHSFEKKIKEQELLFRTVANFAYEWEFWLLPDLQFKYCSPSSERITGYKSEEFLSNPKLLFEIVHPDDKDSFEKHFHEADSENRSEIVKAFEFSIIDKQGGLKFIRHTCSPIYDDQNKYLGRRVTNVDITERKKIENLWKRSEEDYRNIFKNAHDAILILDPENEKVLDANNRALEIYGFTREEFVGKSMRELSKSPAVGDKKIKQVIHDGFVDNFETIQYSKCGTELIFEINGSLIEYKGKPAILSMNHDITERKRAEENLRSREELLSRVINNVDEIIYSVSLAGNNFNATVNFVSAQVKNILGYEPEEFLHDSKLWFKIIHPDDSETVEAQTKLMYENRKSETCIFRMKHKLTGESIWVEDHRQLLFDETNKIIGLFGTARNISERKITENRIQKTNECLLSFGRDSLENINMLTKLCGELMGATAALYNRLDENKLCSWGMWNTPDNYNPVDNPNGHICYDVINGGSNEVCIVRNLQESKYAATDPNVVPYQLKTYVGKAVGLGNTYVGSLCVVFQQDFIPTDSDKWFLGIIASAIGVEEERKQAEEALKGKNTFIQTVLDNLPIGVALNTIDQGAATYFNKKFEEIYGWPAEELKDVARFFQKVYPDENYRNELLTRIMADIQSGDSSRMHWEDCIVTHQDGSKHYVNAVNIPLYDQNMMVSTVADFTIIKEAEQALRDSEERYRKLIDTIPNGVAVYQNGEFVFANTAGLNLMHASSQNELLGKPVLSIVHHDSQKDVMRRMQQVAQGNYVAPFEEKLIRLDGSVFDAEVSAIGTTYKNKPAGLVVVQDITERKKAEEKIQLLAQAVKNTEEGISITDLNNNLIFVNDAFVKIYGYSEKELIGKNIGILRSENNVEPVPEEVKTATITQGWEGELINKKKDGTEFPVLLSTSPVLKENGKPFALLGIVRDITEQKKNQKALIESEEKFRNIVQTASEGIMISDLSNVTAFVNNALAEMLGYLPSELIGKALKDLIFTSDIADYENKIAERAKGVHDVFERKYKRKDGSILIGLVSASALLDNENKYAGALAMITDITEMKNAETALIESEERFRTVYNASPSAISISEIETSKLMEVNDAYEKLFGFSREEVIGRTSFEVGIWTNNEDRNKLKEALIKNNFYDNIEITFKTKNGSLRNCLTSGRIIAINNNEYLLAMVNDITEMKKAGEALRESEQKFRSIFQNHSAIKLLIDPDTGLIEDANEAAANYYGWSIDELKKMKIQEINILPHEQVFERMERTKDQKQTHYEFRHRLKDGSIRDVEVFSSRIEIGGKVFLHSINHDITEKVESENELKKYREHLEELVESRTEELDKLNEDLMEQLRRGKELEMMLRQSLGKEKELNELKTRFISTASHEFRTPLTSVLSSAELIQRYGKRWTEEKFNEHVERIKNSVDYVTKLLDEVLTISRVESGKIAFSPEQMDLYDFCVGIIEEVKPVAKENHELVFNFYPKDRNFTLDSRLLKFILINLLTNAFKYSPNGGKVELSVTASGSFIMFEVKDNGLGIPDEDKQYLFEPFHRCINAGDIPGTGLGLSIVKEAVELHKGEITVQSQLGKESIFKVKLSI